MQADQIATNLSHRPLLAAPARSAVSWGAIAAGAAVGAALSAMLVAGGGGLGFLAMSPWSHEGASAPALAIGSIIWLMVTQVVAFGVAGYVAGRLRTHWSDVRGDEIYFRDTAHGFVVWAVGSLLGLALLGSVAASIVSGTARAGAALTGAGAAAVATLASEVAETHPLERFTDALLRPENTADAGRSEDVRAEVSRLLALSLSGDGLTERDRNYLTRLLAQRTGLTETAAQQRLTEIDAQARQAMAQAEQTAREAADAARKAAAAFSLWAFASLLLGAFVASVAATLGGRARDRSIVLP